MRIGLDLDNTLIDYEAAFCAAAVGRGILPAGTVLGKTALRDRIRELPDGEATWTRLQAFVYGPGIDAAALYPGVTEFIAAARSRAIELVIVSHKSEFAAAAPDGPSLRASARDFLERHRVDLPVYFESTREEKCRRLAAAGVTHAVDDLVEVFEDPAFPPGVARWLFAPRGAEHHPLVDRQFASWDDVRAAVAP